MSRILLASAALLLASSPALAGGAGCGGAECYRRVVTPPVYGTVSQQVMVRPPERYATTVPGEFTTVAERVLVAPASRVWQVSRDAYGHTVGCWVTVPARYAVRHRQVMVRPPQVVQHYQPAQYAVQHRQVLVQPVRAGWAPVGGYGHAGHGYGYGHTGYGHDLGGGGLIGSAIGLGVGAAATGIGLGADLAGGVLGLH